MRRLIIICLCVLSLLSCSAWRTKSGTSVPYSGADDYSPQLLFTVEGVKVFRFIDSGSYHYLAIQPGNITTTREVYTDKTSHPVDDTITARGN